MDPFETLKQTVQSNYQAHKYKTRIPVVVEPYPITLSEPGCLVYDKEKKHLCIYDGEEWKSL